MTEMTKDEFRDYLRGRFLPLEREVVTNAVFAIAWEEGHSSGHQDVEFYYEDLADLVRIVRETRAP